MKKVLLSLGAAMMAVSMNATIYVVGAGDGLTWDLPGTPFQEVENGVYTFEIKNLSKFKASLNNATGWDGDGGFNAGCYGTGSTEFGNSVYPNGQTLPMVAWGEDQSVPWEGDYTITMDFNKNTMTAKTSTPAPVNAPAVYVRGDMNGWGSPATWQLNSVSYDSATGTGEWALECSIPAGQAFKIADASWGNINYGGVTGIKANEWVKLAYNSGTNMTLASAFEGTLRFKITGNKQAEVMFDMQGDAKDPENFYVIGTLAEGAWNPMVGVTMTGNGEGIYTAEAVTLVEDGGSTGFAITANLGATGDDWGTVNALRFGPSVQDSHAVLGVNSDLATGDLSWKFNPGTYKMVFDYKNLTLTITGENGEIIPTVPTNMNVIGSFPTGAWDPNVVMPMTAEGDGVFSIENVTIAAGDDGATMGYFALTTGSGSWDVINANRFGPAVQDTEAVVGENVVDGQGDVSWSIVPGTYNMTFDYNEMILTIESVDGPVVPVVPTNMNLIGSLAIGSWNPDVVIEMTPEGDGVFSATGVTIVYGEDGAEMGYFALTTGRGSWEAINANRFGPAVQDTEAVVGENVVDGRGDLSWSIIPGTYDFVFDYNEMILSIEEAEDTSIVGSLATTGAVTEYYNLQGVKVNNPEKGIFIKVVDGKAVKVVK